MSRYGSISLSPALRWLSGKSDQRFRVTVSLLAGWCLIGAARVVAQTAEYGLGGEALMQDRPDFTQSPMPGGGSVDMAPAGGIPGMSQSVGAARSGVRSRGGESVMLRYDQHREIQPPDYATFRLGPLYSNLGISQSIGYRYVRLKGTGVDFLEGTRRGEVRKTGAEFPMVSGLTLNNYMILTRKLDLQANISAQYFYYPLRTQDDELRIRLTDEGVFATFSTQFHPTRDSRILLYDDILYRTDFIDTRGLEDSYGGRKFEYLRNVLGLDWDWRPTPLDLFSVSASRTDLYPFDSEFDRQRMVRYAQMGSYRRSLTPFAAAGVVGSMSQSFYKEASRPDVYTYGITAFTGMRLAPRLSANASLGHSWATSTGGNLEDDRKTSSITAAAALDHDISDTRHQRLSWQRRLSEAFDGGMDVSDTFGYQYRWSGSRVPGAFSTTYAIYDPKDRDRNGYTDWTTRLNVRYPLTRLMDLSLVASYGIRRNDTPTRDDELPDISSDYETLTLSASTGFRVTDKTMFSAYATHVERTSDNRDLAYTRDTVGVTLKWSHQF